ncbi:MAG: flippase-like domain-containing protein [Micrococcales bacterium]|nr:flippase-like domain-containing protein [Micrococcales bacterium]
MRKSSRPGRQPRTLASRSEVIQGVEVVDAPEQREHHTRDLVGMGATVLGVLTVTALATYAPGTYKGMTQDVLSMTSAVTAVFKATTGALMNAATLLAPAAVLASLLFRRQFWLALQGAIAGVASFGVALGAAWSVRALDYEPMMHGLSVGSLDHLQVAIAPLAAAMAGILTAVGPSSRRAILRASWNLLWLALVVWVLTGGGTLPSAFITVLLGRLVGQAVRYLGGVSTDRASGRGLVEGIRRAGIDPVRVVRVRDISDPENPTERLNVKAIRDGSFNPAPFSWDMDRAVSATQPAASPEAMVQQQAPPASVAVSDSIALALERQAGNRVYAVYTKEGERWDALVLDGDQQVVGLLQRTWRALRLRGMDQRSVVSLRQAAERAALLSYAAASAGVRTPTLHGIGEAADSMMLLQAHPAGLRSISDMRAREVQQGALEELWRQLELAHGAGLAHRSISQNCLLFGMDKMGNQTPWLIGWDNGDVASSELARALDRAQLAATLALRIGPERTVAAAARVLDADALAQVASLIQPVALPSQTREEARGRGEVLDALRQTLLDQTPGQPLDKPPSLVRLGWSKVILLTLALVAVVVILTTQNFSDMVDAVSKANLWWMALAFGLALVTYVGAAMTLKGLHRDRISLWKATLSQVAASFWALVAPGGIGPAATALRFLSKQGSKTALAVATVALSQIALVFTTLLMLLGAGLSSGQTGVLSNLPAKAIVLVVAGLAVLASLLLIPRLRGWLWLKIGPTFAQVWPALTWVLSRPKRVIFAMAGTVIQTGGYIAAFWAVLQAFGVSHLSLLSLAIVYLIGNSAGSAVPTPGGAGGVEIALTTSLVAAGIPAAMAFSVALVFRLVTYWFRVPLGWMAFRHLQRHGDF